MREYAPVPVLTAALGCRCPRCGRGRLYQGVLTVRASCTECGLDLAAFDAGDGAAAFVIFLLGAIVMALALWVEFTFEPPLWLHVVLWTPVTIGGAVLLIRPLKAGLIAQEYRVRQAGPE
jgi:uncharacterized protein (DUF983 family)